MMLANIGWSILLVAVFYMERVEYGFKEYKIISKYYRFLVNKVKQHENVEIINEWLIDNYYLDIIFLY